MDREGFVGPGTGGEDEDEDGCWAEGAWLGWREEVAMKGKEKKSGERWRGEEVGSGSDVGGRAEEAAARAEGNIPVRAEAEQRRMGEPEDIRQQPDAARDALTAGGGEEDGQEDGQEDGGDDADSDEIAEQKIAAAREDHAANPHAGRVPRGKL